MPNEVDLKELVNRGHLDLNSVFRDNAEITELDVIGSFVFNNIACDVVLQKAKNFGLVAYCWIGRNKISQWGRSQWYLDREAAIVDAQATVKKHKGEDNNVEELTQIGMSAIIEQILGTQWFEKDVNKADIDNFLYYANERVTSGHVMIERNGNYGTLHHNSEFEKIHTIFIAEQKSWMEYATELLKATQDKTR